MDNKIHILKSLKVLLVEDNPDIREGVSRFLLRRVGNLVTAVNGKEGLELFQTENPDVIVSDIRMPVMDGLAMVKAIREKNIEIPVVITSGHNDEKFLLESINLGVDRYLKKPIIYEDLVETLNRLGKLAFQKRELDRKNHILNLVFDNSAQFFLILEDFKVIYMNRPFLDYLGFSNLGEFDSSDVRLEDYLVRNKDCYFGNKNFIQIFFELSKNPDVDYVVQMKSKEGWQDDVSSFLLTLRPVPGTSQYLVSFSDVTMMEMVRSLYQEQALRDPLTRILNRKKFFSELQSEIERFKRYGSSFSLLMLDIDHFKQVNDRYGHQVGDKVLMTLTLLVRNRIRKLDKFGRYGGEEFVLLLPATPLKSAVELAEDLRVLIEQNDFSPVPKLTVSFGVVSYRKGEVLDHLVKRVDEVLYLAKKNGRNRVECDSSDDDNDDESNKEYCRGSV